uniref:Dna polymerase B n=1 Tax=Siphoviridae sp. ctD2Q91 TaxID=2825383 RepID=A0A8S5PPP4_9CAUD|nr:MAG TPA: Dna polymerase B [Siphoviridae sp. ctD2Q91]
MAEEKNTRPCDDMSESRIKFGRKQRFTVLYKSAIEDKRLPLDARGLLAIMVGLPDGWQYSVKGLAAYVGVSKDTIRRLLEKLEKVGYLTREQTHDENGHFAGNVYVLQDEAPPLSENTDNGEHRQREKPSSGFPTQINTKRTKDRKNQTPIAPAEVEKCVVDYCGEDDELREAIMGLLENRIKVNRKKAVVTDAAMKLILRKLDRLSDGRREVKLAMLRKAITYNWLTVFELKPDEMPPVENEGSAALPLGWGV